MGDAHGDTDGGGGENTDKECAANLENQQRARDEKADDCYQRSSTGDVGDIKRDALALADDTLASVIQTDKGNEEADTHRDRFLQIEWDAVQYRFADIESGKQNEDETFNKDCSQCKLRGVPHAEDNSEGKEGVESHPRSEGEGHVCIQAHDKGGNHRRQCCGGEDAGKTHPCCREDSRVDGENIGHGHKGGKACEDFSADGCFVLTEFECLFKKSAAHGWLPALSN